jgi:hypothetical protein
LKPIEVTIVTLPLEASTTVSYSPAAFASMTGISVCADGTSWVKIDLALALRLPTLTASVSGTTPKYWAASATVVSRTKAAAAVLRKNSLGGEPMKSLRNASLRSAVTTNALYSWPLSLMKVRRTDAVRVTRTYCSFSLASPSFCTTRSVRPMAGAVLLGIWNSWIERWPMMWFSKRKPPQAGPGAR